MTPHPQRRRNAATPSGRGMHRIGSALLAALVVTGLGAILADIDAASAVDDGTMGIRPATSTDYFHLSLYPGAETEVEAIVTNRSSAPLELSIYPVDGMGSPQGTFAFGAEGAETVGVGEWVDLGVDSITVPAESELRVPVRLSVPPGTPPGDYAGGIIIQPPVVEGDVTEVGDDTAVRLDVVQRQGLRIYLDVAGEAISTLDHGPLTWVVTGDSTTYSLPVTNTGNTILSPVAELQVTSHLGADADLRFTSPESLLPGSTFTLTATVPDPPLVQWATAHADLQSEAGSVRLSADVLSVPWLLVATALLVLILGGVVAWRVARFVRRAKAALEREGAATMAAPATARVRSRSSRRARAEPSPRRRRRVKPVTTARHRH